MTCLIVGADKLGTKTKHLKEMGFREVVHWSGRTLRLPPQLPNKINLVVVFTGFINHGHMREVRKMARKAGVKVIYLKRGLAELSNATMASGEKDRIKYFDTA